MFSFAAFCCFGPTVRENLFRGRQESGACSKEMISLERETTMTDCPDSKILTQLAQDKLSREQQRTVEDHLHNCPECLSEFCKIERPTPYPNIDGFHIAKELGRGRFGIVYKAWWLTDRPKIIALKILTYAGDMEKQRFEREVNVLKKIDSPRIVKCLGDGRCREAQYYIMDYVEGTHLDEHLVYHTTSLEEKLDVFRRVCSAVADAHAQGVVHRDLKPRNILIDEKNDPYILDFGICSLSAAEWNSSMRGTITRKGDLIGTLKYMSPEQAWGGAGSPVDTRSDIWALGVMLYEIVSDGDYPYELGPTEEKTAQEALLERIRKESPKRPNLQTIRNGRDLEILIERCLAFETEHRIESAQKLADDLCRYCYHSPIQTKPTSTAYYVKRIMVGAAIKSRWRVFSIAIAIVLASLYATLYFGRAGWRNTVFLHNVGGTSQPISMKNNAKDAIVIAGIGDETIPAIKAFAEREGLPGVTNRAPSWRAVHGQFMEKLAHAKPTAVIWDYFFRSPQPGDEALVRGMNALISENVPVILASKSYRADGTPDLSPAITQNIAGPLHHGAIVARHMVRRPGEFIVAFRRGETVIPHLSITVVAAILHNDCALEIDWPDRSQELELIYRTGPGAYLRERDRVPLKWGVKAGQDDQGVNEGELFALKTFELNAPEEWQQRTIAYETLLNAGADDLRRMTQGKIILVADVRLPRLGLLADAHPVRYGPNKIITVPGGYLQADAITSLLNGDYIRAAFPPTITGFVAALFLAIFSCAISIRLAAMRFVIELRSRKVVWITFATLVVTSVLTILVSREHMLVQTAMASFVLFSIMACALWLELARNRHRILEKSRQSFESFGFDNSETQTIT